MITFAAHHVPLWIGDALVEFVTVGIRYHISDDGEVTAHAHSFIIRDIGAIPAVELSLDEAINGDDRNKTLLRVLAFQHAHPVAVEAMLN